MKECLCSESSHTSSFEQEFDDKLVAELKSHDIKTGKLTPLFCEHYLIIGDADHTGQQVYELVFKGMEESRQTATSFFTEDDAQNGISICASCLHPAHVLWPCCSLGLWRSPILSVILRSRS